MILWILLISTVILVFRSWFSYSLISAGDLSFFYHDWLVYYFNLPNYWETFRNLGFGGRSFLFQGVYLYNIPLGFLSNFFDYIIAERIIWFFPIILLGFISPILLAGELKLFPKKFYPFSIFLYFLNSYFLMIMGGGQLTVVLGYLFIPICLAFFLKCLFHLQIKNLLLFSLSICLIIAWDFRFLYLVTILITLLSIWYLAIVDKDNRKIITRNLFITFPVISIITFLVHFYWLFPFLLYFENPVSGMTSAYTTVSAVKFFSFADFSHSLSLLHPNWPENIFGKTYFTKPEYLFLPLIAYSSLLFLTNRQKQNSLYHRKWIIFFSFIGLMGSFFGKGVNPPGGEIYSFLFSKIPGFVMFRDPTKWYTLTALSFSLLIPFSVYQFSILIKKKFNSFFSELSIFCIVIYLLLLLKPALMGEVKGTLSVVNKPSEYDQLKKMIAKPDYFRTIWIPSWQRFGYFSNNHPSISGSDYFHTNDPDKIVKILAGKEAEKEFKNNGIRYLIIPYDNLGEIFLTERKYDVSKRLKIEKELDKIKWLTNKNKVGNITVYEINGYKKHFWIKEDEISINSKFINPSKYSVKVTVASKKQLIFSETYDNLWQFSGKNFLIESTKTNNNQNSFYLPHAGIYEGLVEFVPQKFVLLYTLISIFSLTILIIITICIYLKKIYQLIITKK